jgi:hypothetical protein
MTQPPVATIYQTDFSGGIPADWLIGDGYGDGKTWTSVDSCYRGAPPYGSGTFIIVDSDCAGYYTWMDEQLVSSSIDCTNLEQVTLSFNHEFQYGGGEIADVDIRSNGGAWNNLARYTGFTYGNVQLDLSAVANHQPDVQIRWHYYNANYAWYWIIDDVQITARSLASPILGDFGQDCAVDFADFRVIADAWLSQSGQGQWNQACDISSPADDIINLKDVAVFASNWLRTQ